MQYMGGKARIAKQIAEVMLSRTDRRGTYLEPFLGGCNVLPEMAPHFAWKVASDAMADVAMLWAAIRDGWEPPDFVAREQYSALRDAEPSALRGFVGFGCSFGGKWFGGYGAQRVDAKHPTGHVSHGSAKCARLARSSLLGVAIDQSDYRRYQPGAGVVAYCDPPYAGTTPYKGAPEWNAQAFWATMRAWVDNGATVFVSEYSAPSDWASVWSKTANVGSLKKDGNAAPVTEHLFMHESQAGRR